MSAEWGRRLYRAPYLVLPRLGIESMPQEWQDRLETLLQEADAMGLETPSYYVLRDKEEPGCDPFIRGLKDVTSASEPREFLRFHGRHGIPDPWANYRHGKIEDVCPTFKRPEPERVTIPADSRPATVKKRNGYAPGYRYFIRGTRGKEPSTLIPDAPLFDTRYLAMEFATTWVTNHRETVRG